MISIIIPVYNGEKYLRRAIDSVLKQAGCWELIIVNDHSTDNTSAILAEFVSGNARIRVVNSESKGVTDARLTGARAALGKYLFFMDADDELPENIVSKMEKCIEDYPSVDIVIGDIIEIREQKNTYHKYGEKHFDDASQLFDWIIDNRTGYLWGKAIKRDLFMLIPYVPSELKFCEDYIQMLQLTLYAHQIKHICEESYIYYQNPESACNSIKSKEDYARQFYDLSVALGDLTEIMNGKISVRNLNRVKVMFLFYCRLYLSVSGGWENGISKVRSRYKEWMSDKALELDRLYDKKRRRQTKIAYWIPWLIAMIYVPVLRYKYNRIK